MSGIHSPSLPEDISVPIAINIRGLPVATGRLAIDRSAVKALLNVVNGARYPNPTGLPTIENLQSLIYKLGNYSIYNERAFVSLQCHATVTLDSILIYPIDANRSLLDSISMGSCYMSIIIHKIKWHI